MGNIKGDSIQFTTDNPIPDRVVSVVTEARFSCPHGEIAVRHQSGETPPYVVMRTGAGLTWIHLALSREELLALWDSIDRVLEASK